MMILMKTNNNHVDIILLLIDLEYSSTRINNFISTSE